MQSMTLGRGRWVLMFLLYVLLVFGGASVATASDIRGGQAVIIPQGEVIDDDLVVFGNTIVVNGTVNGDLVAFANTISVNGTVNGSALLAGQTIRVNGEINGTLYSGSSAIILGPDAVIERNVMVGAYSLESQPGSLISRDLSMAGAQAVLAGKVGRDVQFAGQALELNGQIGRNVRAEVADPNQTPFGFSMGPDMPETIASGLRVGRNAKINGQLSYASTVDQANEILAAPGGGIVFQAQPVATVVEPPAVTYEWFFNRLRDFISVLVVGLLALWLARPWVNAAVQHARTRPLAATGWGVLLLIASYALALVAFLVLLLFGILLGTSTLGGLALTTLVMSLAGSALYVTVLTALVVWGTKVIVSVLIGKLLLERIAHEYAESAVTAFLLGLVLFEIVASIPVLGLILTILSILLGLGAIWYVYYDRRRPQVQSMSSPAPMPA